MINHGRGFSNTDRFHNVIGHELLGVGHVAKVAGVHHVCDVLASGVLLDNNGRAALECREVTLPDRLDAPHLGAEDLALSVVARDIRAQDRLEMHLKVYSLTVRIMKM